MRMLFVILVLALLAIVFEVYSDVSLTSASVSHAVRDLAAAIAHGVEREWADDERVTNPTILAARVSSRAHSIAEQSTSTQPLFRETNPGRMEPAAAYWSAPLILELAET
jgi:hypothetical protein